MNENKHITKKKVVIIVILTGIIIFIAGAFSPVSNYYKKVLEKNDASNCNVAGVPIEGYLGSFANQIIDGEVVGASSKDIVQNLLLAEADPHIKAILLSVDSSGGDAFAGEEIANALKSLTKPTVAVIRSVGLSSAYWASTGADVIFASPMSSVGDIGITASYLDETAKDKMEGYKYIEITSTKLKDAGNPHRPLSAEEQKSWIDSVKEDHKIFVSEVAENRNLDINDVDNLADGTSLNGMGAIDNGLADKLGDTITATDYISDQIGEKAEVCWY